MNKSNQNNLQPHTGDALLIVDVQNDFLPGGSLEVPRGDEVVTVLNRYLDIFAMQNLPVYATRDWHPEHHCSFREQGGPWPPHCVANTNGAAFAAALQLPPAAVIISKATTVKQDPAWWNGWGWGKTRSARWMSSPVTDCAPRRR